MAQPTPPGKLSLDLKLPLEFLKRANLRGVVGNISSIAIVGLIAIIVIAIVSIWTAWYTATALLMAVLLVIVFITTSVRRTLKDDPGSVLEDQLYFEYRKMQMEAAKDRPPSVIVPPAIQDPDTPELPSGEDGERDTELG